MNKMFDRVNIHYQIQDVENTVKLIIWCVRAYKMSEILIKIFDETDMQKIGALVKDLKQTGMIVGNNIKFKGEVY